MLRDVHEAWAWVMIIGNGLAGVWATAASRVNALRTRALWWFVAIVQVSVFVQAVLGVAMVAGQDRKVQQFHMFYGFVAMFAVGILYGYRSQMRHRLYLLYGLGSLFVMGLGIRAILVGPA